MSVKIQSAIFNSRPKTKFLNVHGVATVESFEDNLQVEIAEPQGINPAILLLSMKRIDGEGSKKIQDATFSFSAAMMSGKLPYKQVQIDYEGDSDVLDIVID